MSRIFSAEEQAAHSRSIPRKRMGAGVVLLNEEGKILFVNPTYKEPWEIPGGAVEDNESPREAARRETKEEIGLDIEVGPLLAMGYGGPRDGKNERLALAFDGGVLTQGQIDSIVLEDELSEFQFLTLDEIGDRITKASIEKLKHALKVKENGGDAYFEISPGE